MQATNTSSDAQPSLFVNFIRRIQEDWKTEKGCNPQIKLKEIYSDDFDSTFSDEVQALMYACGDVRNPKWISVLTLCAHLRGYLNTLIADANRIANMRGEKYIEHQSILFLLRKKKEKLQRLLAYLKIKDYKSSLTKKYEHNAESSQIGPRVHDCVKFLEEIFTPRVVNNLRDQKELDLFSQRRLQRNDSRTQDMSPEEYMEFSEKQKCSFVKDGLSVFGHWVMKDFAISLKPTTRSLEIINFLVRDYIAEVIDEVLLQRERQQKLSHFSSSSQKRSQPKPQPSPKN